jgi:phosphoribosyl 1,2-cyclic phosphodiesterase
VRLLFCGVRGSTPAPGIDFVRVGGHTACVAIAHDGQPWSLVLDAGTGIRRVTNELDGAPFTGALLLTHLHWDHVEGLPFFAAGDRDDSHVRVLIPDQDGADVTDVLARGMSPPHFPIGPDGLRGSWTFEGIAPGRHEVEGFVIEAFDVPHKGGRTFGFRVSDPEVDGAHGGSVAYIPDHLPAAETNAQIARVCAGVDLLVHDSQFVESERAVADLYGHATIDDGIALAQQCGARTLALFHHGPARTDDDVEAIGEAASKQAASKQAASGPGVEVVVAREGAVIELAGGSP